LGIGDRPITDDGQRRAMRIALIGTVGFVGLGALVFMSMIDNGQAAQDTDISSADGG